MPSSIYTATSIALPICIYHQPVLPQIAASQKPENPRRLTANGQLEKKELVENSICSVFRIEKGKDDDISWSHVYYIQRLWVFDSRHRWCVDGFNMPRNWTLEAGVQVICHCYPQHSQEDDDLLVRIEAKDAEITRVHVSIVVLVLLLRFTSGDGVIISSELFQSTLRFSHSTVIGLKDTIML